MNGRALLGPRFFKIFKYVCLLCILGITTFSLIRWEPSASFLLDFRLNNCLSDSEAFSTCGCRGDSRGSHQKVVSFSLYGNFSNKETHERYVKAMESVAGQVHSAYPDWIIRIYTTAENGLILKKTFETEKYVDICPVESVIDEARPYLVNKADKMFPMVWRFLPLLDPMVDLFMSRDADSFIFEREIVAVQEWLNSTATFHIMRDHQRHCIFNRYKSIQSLFLT